MEKNKNKTKLLKYINRTNENYKHLINTLKKNVTLIDKNNINVEDIELFYENLLELKQILKILTIHTKLVSNLKLIETISEKELIEYPIMDKLELCKSVEEELRTTESYMKEW